MGEVVSGAKSYRENSCSEVGVRLSVEDTVQGQVLGGKGEEGRPAEAGLCRVLELTVRTRLGA